MKSLDHELVVCVDDDALAKLRYAASEAGISVEDLLRQTAMKRANALVAKAEKQTLRRASQTTPTDYVPQNYHSPWVRIWGSGQGRFASTQQAVETCKASRR